MQERQLHLETRTPHTWREGEAHPRALPKTGKYQFLGEINHFTGHNRSSLSGPLKPRKTLTFHDTTSIFLVVSSVCKQRITTKTSSSVDSMRTEYHSTVSMDQYTLIVVTAKFFTCHNKRRNSQLIIREGFVGELKCPTPPVDRHSS